MKTVQENIIFQLYDAVGKEDAWSPLIEKLCSHLDASIGILVFIGQGQFEQDFYATHNFSESCAKAYAEHWWQHNIWLNTGSEKGLFVKGSVLIGTEHVSTQTLHQTAFYREFLTTMPAEHLMTVTMLEEANEFDTPPMTLNFFRPPGATAFNQTDAEALRQLYPHIQRAFNLHWQWRTMQEQLITYHASLDSLDFGVMFIDPARRVRQANHRAKLYEAALLPMLAPNAKRNAVTTLVDDAGKGAGGATLLDDIPLLIMALPVSKPVRNSAGETRASVMLLLVNPSNRTDAAADFISNAFALSKAESRLVPLILQGKNPTEMAETLGLKMPTVRSQLSNIFAKTGTSRQQELLQLLGTVPPINISGA